MVGRKLARPQGVSRQRSGVQQECVPLEAQLLAYAAITPTRQQYRSTANNRIT